MNQVKKICVLAMVAVAPIRVAATPQESTEISPYLFGQNHWMADGDEDRVGYLHELWDEVQKSGVSLVRIGGNGYRKDFPSDRELESMVRSIKGIGAAVLLQIPETFTNEEVERLVRKYSNSDELKTEFWSIGNEPRLHDEYTIEETFAYTERIARVVKRTAPQSKVFIFDPAWVNKGEYARLCGGDLDLCGLKEGDVWLVDGINFHSYPNGKEFDRDDVVFAGPAKIENDMLYLKQLIQKAAEQYGRTGNDALSWSLTEVNVTYINPDRDIRGIGNPSFLGGQFLAEMFALGMKHDAFTVAPWCINETDRVATDFGYIGLPTEFHPRSAYYHMKMMSELMPGSYVDASATDRYLKVCATEHDGSLAVLLMNQALNRNMEVRLRTGDLSERDGSVEVVIESDTQLDLRVALKAQSSMVLRMDLEGSFKNATLYGLEENLKFEAPRIVEEL